MNITNLCKGLKEYHIILTKILVTIFGFFNIFSMFITFNFVCASPLLNVLLIRKTLTLRGWLFQILLARFVLVIRFNFNTLLANKKLIHY